MKRRFIILIALMSSLFASAQTVYVFKSEMATSGKTFHLVAPGDSLTIANNFRKKYKLERKVVSAAGRYSFNFNVARNMDQILDSAGHVLAYTKGFFDITLPDGTFYDHVNGEGKTWNYLLNKKAVIKGEYAKVEDEQRIIVTWIDSNVQGKELVYMMTQIFGIDLIQKRISNTPIIIVGVMAGILSSVITMTNQNDAMPR